MMTRQYFIYIMTNQNHTVLYNGVTNDLQRRVMDHKTGKGGIFSRKYKLYILVYYEMGEDVSEAISREKQINSGSRKKKIAMINSINPNWDDLYQKHFG